MVKCLLILLFFGYICEIEISDEGEWGDRVKSISITHEDYINKIPSLEKLMLLLSISTLSISPLESRAIAPSSV